jgi:hypothetical protein
MGGAVLAALNVLTNIRIASPCTVPWAVMKGNQRVRYCDACKLNVYNLSSISRAAAEELLLAHEGRICVEFWRRADGTVLTRDCPRGLARVRFGFLRVMAATAAALLLAAGALRAFATGDSNSSGVRLRYVRPFWSALDYLRSLEPKVWIESARGGAALGPPRSPEELHADFLNNREFAFTDPASFASLNEEWIGLVKQTRETDATIETNLCRD